MVGMAEHWHPVPGFEGLYEIAPDGRVRSLDRVIVRSNGIPYTAKGQLMRPKRHHPCGLLSVSLSRAGKHRTCYVHRLVEAAFGDTEARAA
jgi:hypothetical protein